MADKRCDNGHFIDESWDLCPYCPQDESEPEIPVVRPRSVDPSSPRSLAQQADRAALPLPASLPPPSAASPAPAHVELNGALNGALAVQAPPMDRTIASAQLTPKRYVVGWLVGLNAISRGESFPVRMGRNVIGRDKRSDIVIHDEQASSHHADLVFRPEERRFILMDHNSTNGTYVNETEIEPRRDLAANDVIRIGSQRFLFAPLCHEGFYWDDEGLLK